MVDISVVIPLYNEQDSLFELTSWIDKVILSMNKSYEIIYINDGSNDNSWSVIEDICSNNNNVRAISFVRNYGKAAALYVGFEKCDGDVVITMDADLQDSPDEIPALYKMIKEQGYDLVSGWKRKRYDPINKTLPSKFFNLTARVVSGIKIHDFNCGLKAYNHKVIKNIEVYGEMHRYIPILAKYAGFKKIGEKEVQHHPRIHGVSKYGWERMIKGYLDLLSVVFMQRFGRSPMYLFGTLGTMMFIIGFCFLVYVIAYKHIMIITHQPFREITSQPLFYVSLTSSIMGVQLFLAGFIGELIGRSSSDRNTYKIEKIIDK